MVDDVKDITEKAESKEALDRARLARERREAEQRKRLDELRAHAAAAQAQREKRDEDRRKRQADQRARDDDRRQQVEERKRAIWEASISRREALLQRERDRTERLERARAARSAPRPAFAFGSSTPRLLEPVDSAGFFWAARSTNPLDQMNFFESLAASTTNVMYASAPLTRRASALQLDSSDTDNKGLMFSSFHEADRSPQAVMWSSVARRRTDLVPTVPAPRAPGRAYSMTRLDKLATRPLHSASPSMHHLNRSHTRSGETTPGSRPGSAMSNATGVVRRANSAPRKPRPASIAGTGCNTPRGETGGISATSTPAVSRDGSTVARPATTPRRPRPLSLHVSSKPVTPLGPGEGKPPMHRKPKSAKDQDKSRGKSQSASPGRPLSPSPAYTKETSVDKEMSKSITSERPVDPQKVTQKLEALQVYDEPKHIIDNKENIETNIEKNVRNVEQTTEVKIEVQKPVETEDTQKIVPKEQKIEPKKESSVEKNDENEMTASMISRRITTEGEAKAALAERRRRAREELERQAELERIRLQREAEEEEERQRQEEERQRREEEEARELAALQRRMEEEKLKKAIEAQQQLERDEAERKVREEVEKQARLREEEEKKRAAEEAEKSRKEELEREEKERLARKQRVEAIMARTRLKKQAEEDKKKQEQNKAPVNQSAETQNQISAQPPVPKIEQVAQDTTDSKSVQDKPLDSVNVTTVTETVNVTTNATESVNVTTNATESVNVTTNATESVNVTTNATESVNVTTVTESVNMSEPDTIKVGVPIISELINVAEPISDLNISDSKVSEIVNLPNVVDSLNELAKDSAKEVTDNGNVQTEDLLSLATSQPEGKSESWQPHNGNIAPLAPLARTDNKLSQESSGEHSSKMDNANVETNNGNVTSVGHISANFLHSERMSEHNQEEFTTHNGHGIGHPLTLQNAI
ncbi:MAP7 domain-containing protein 2-like isoform X3 [Pieris brassicae]|uniref:MAP7 domain-containing protein 2-like isoform X3 n=1 Tax=Pieris brassicae TaxID=7116 RepID=UPI001E65E3FD|nr:MAP7 domain-containing protein 2-like isoform X3 [Pieris brassicae]